MRAIWLAGLAAFGGVLVLPSGSRAQQPRASSPSAARRSAEPYKQRGDQLARAGKLDVALREYRAALSIDPTYSEAYNELGSVHMARREVSLAITQYRLALSQTDEFSPARYNLAFALRKAGRFPEAANEYRRYLAARGDDPDGHYGLGETLKALGDGGGARAAFERYVALEKRPSEAQWIARAKAEIASFDKAGVSVAAPVAVAASTLPAPIAAAAQPLPSAPAEPSPLPTATLAPAKRLGPALAPKPAAESIALQPARRVSPAPSPKPTEPSVAPAAPKIAETPKLAAAPVAKVVEAPKPAPIAKVAEAPKPTPAPVAKVVDAPKPTPAPVAKVVDAGKPVPPAFAKGPGTVVAIADAATKARAPATQADALAAQGEAAFRLRDYGAARARFEAAAKVAPKRADLHHRLAAARAASGDLKAAIDAWDEVVRLDPRHTAANDFALRAREKLGLIAPIAADAAGAAAGSASPEESPVAVARRHARSFVKTGASKHLMAQARALMAAGRYARAVRVLLEVAALQGDAALPYYHLAACHRRLGEMERSAYFARLYLRVVDASDSGATPRIEAARRWARANP